MADLSFKIRADVSELEKAYKVIDDFEKKIVNINKALGEVNPGGKKFKELAKELGEVEKQYEKSIKRIAELENIVTSLNESQKLVNITKEVTTSTNEATQVFVKYAGSLEDLDRRVKELTKEYLSMNAAQKGSSQGQGVINEIAILNSQRKIEADSLRALQKEYVNTQRMQDLQEGSITALRAQLSQLTATYDNMGRSMRNSASGKELIGSIQLVTTELNEAEQASMRFNRNVGNYASGWNGLNVQVQQVARELPAMAMGANTFFLAISNNLPMLGDELKRAKEEYKALKAEGKNATPVWKQVASSLFSWQTALVAGVTILSMYGKEVWNWTKSLFSAEVQLEKLASAEELLAGARRKGFKDSIKEKTELELLYKASQDHKRSIEERKAAVDKLQSLFPTYFGNLKDEKILAGEAAGAYNKLTAQILATANARAIADKIGENSTKIFDMRGELAMELAILKQLGDARVKANEEYDRKAKEGFGTATAKIYARDAVAKADIEFKQQEKIVNAIIAQREKLKKVNESLSKEVNVKDLSINVNDPIKEPTKKSYFDTYAQAKEIEKASQSVKDAVIKSETGILQQQIDLMDEGSNKLLAQIRLNYEKRFSEIQKEERELLQKLQDEERKQWEKKNPDYKKKNLQFTPTVTELPKEDKDRFDKEYSLAYQQQGKDANDLLDKLLAKHQDYTAKRLAIEKKYNEDIVALDEQRKQAEDNGDTGKVEQIDRAKAQATKDKGKELMGLDYEQLKQSPEYVRVFENLKHTSSETLNSLLSQLENAKRTAAQVLSPDQLREYTSTIQSILNELDERNPFQALTDKKQELAEAEKELAQAQVELENARQRAEAVKGGSKIENGPASSKYNPSTGKIDLTRVYLTESQALDKVREKTEKYNSSKDKVVEKSAKVKKSEQDVTDQINELSKAIDEVGRSIGGPAGEIISLIGEIGDFTMMAINGVKMAADTSAQAISTVEKASVILMIISAAIQLATKVASMFAADYSDYNTSKENYEKYVQVLDVVIGKQKELIETLTGRAAVKASKDALELIEKQAQAARNLGKERLNAGASAGSSSIGVRIKKNMSDEGWSEVKNSIGVNAYNKIKDGRMEGLFDLSVEQLKKLQMQAPEFWAKLDDDVSDYLNQIIACNESAEEMKNILNESLTNVSFDTVKDSFFDALSDMDSSAADFADDLSSYMQRAILNTMMAKTYEKRLNDWYESFANSNKDGEIDKVDYGKLKDEWEDIVSDALMDRDKLKEVFGWTSGDASSQSSTKGAFQTMSQDVGNELSGRFTAFNISNDGIFNQSILQTELLSSINEKMSVDQGTGVNVENGPSNTSPIDELREILTANYTQRENYSSQLIGQITILTGEVTGLKGIVDEMRTKQAEQLLNISDVADHTGVIAKNIPTLISNSEATKNSCKSLAGK